MFNVEEITLMSLYRIDNKDNLLEDLKKVKPYIEDPEILEMTNKIIKNLENLSDKEFKKIDFSQAINEPGQLMEE